jgi:hypothetical protein
MSPTSAACSASLPCLAAFWTVGGFAGKLTSAVHADWAASTIHAELGIAGNTLRACIARHRPHFGHGSDGEFMDIRLAVSKLSLKSNISVAISFPQLSQR